MPVRPRLSTRLFESESAFSIVALLGCSVLLLANAITYGYGHDEEQFVAAGVLGKSLLLYRDFPFLQTPYWALVLSALFSFIEGDYFFYARVLCGVFAIGSLVISFFLFRRITNQNSIAISMALLFAISDASLLASGNARNDIFPIFLSWCSLYFFACIVASDSPKNWQFCVAGAFSVAAVGAKVSWAFLPMGQILYIIWIWWQSPKKHGGRALLWFSLGGMLTATPVLWLAAIAFQKFIYGNILYHLSAPYIWYTSNGLTKILEWPAHTFRFFKYFNDPAITSFFLIITTLIIVAYLDDRLPTFAREILKIEQIVFVWLFVLSIPFSLMPRPTHLQYTMPTTILLAIGTAAIVRSSWQIFDKNIILTFRGLIIACAIFGCIHGLWNLQYNFRKFIHGKGGVASVQSDSAALREASNHYGISGKVATLSPIRVLDARLQIYSQLSTGPFFYRTSNYLSDQEIKALNGISPKTMKDVFKDDPPSAIYFGFEPPWSESVKDGTDASLEEYCHEKGFKEVPLRDSRGRLFINPSAAPLAQ